MSQISTNEHLKLRPQFIFQDHDKNEHYRFILLAN